MIECSCKTVEGYRTEYAINYVDYNVYCNRKYSTKKYDTAFTFDIETSKYCVNRATEEFVSFVYHWQLCDEDYNVVFGRDIESLISFFKKISLSYKKKVVIYVHNLSYEFQFIKDFFDWDDVFAIDKHTIIKATSDNLEFRCSYKLTNMNLKKLIENTPNHFLIKGTNDLDYSVLRTPQTDMTVTEKGYCYNDVYCLMHSIQYLLREDSLDTIPLTSTGYVRRECRKAMRNKEDIKIFNKSKITDINLYNHIHAGFRGGNTASSRYHTNTIIKNVDSYDMTSAYPFVMMTEEFPYGKFMYGTIENVEELYYYNNKYCTVANYKFVNLRLYDREPIPYLPIAKATRISKKNLCYNGRVIECDYVEIVLTNVDFDIIDKMYDYDDLIVDDFYFSKKRKLPHTFRKVIMKYYALKTKLKGGDFYMYSKSKKKLNALYGMLVSKIVRAEYLFVNKILEEKEVNPQKSLDRYNSSRNSFLVYQWGVWVTAYCRRNLQRAINEIGIDVVYCDTDSVKFINNHDNTFEKINNEIMNATYDIDIYSVDNRNNKLFLGVWEKEKSYDFFVTLGAKKYAYVQDGEIGVTVSGLNKDNAKKELADKGGLEFFRDGEIFFNSGRTSVEYVNVEKPYKITINNEEVLISSHINIFDVTYTLGITDTMLDIINSSKNIK